MQSPATYSSLLVFCVSVRNRTREQTVTVLIQSLSLLRSYREHEANRWRTIMSRRFNRTLHENRKICKLFGRKGVSSVFNLVLSPVTLLTLIVFVTAALSFGDENDVIGGMATFAEDGQALRRNMTDSVAKVSKRPAAAKRPESVQTLKMAEENPSLPALAPKIPDSNDRSTDLPPAKEEKSRPKTVAGEKFGVEVAIGKSERPDAWNPPAYKDKPKLVSESEGASAAQRSASSEESGSKPEEALVTTKPKDSGDGSSPKAYPHHSSDASEETSASPAESTPQRKPKKLPTIERKPDTPGKVQDYAGSHLEDGSSMVRGQNVTRLSYAIYKVVRLFHLKKLTDFPASSHTEWMPEMVTRFEYDVPGFRYDAYDLDKEKLTASEKAGEAYGSADFKVVDPEVEIPESNSDMFLVWTELDGTRTDPRSQEYGSYIVNIVKAAKKAHMKYIVFGQFPRMKGMIPIYAKGRWRFMGKSKEEVCTDCSRFIFLLGRR